MINILTACSHPENLPKIYNSIIPFYKGNITWWIVYDLDKGEMKLKDYLEFNDVDWIKKFWFKRASGEKGYPQKNYGLDLIKKDWVWVLDDDNILHPDLIETIESVRENFQGILFRQMINSKDIRMIDPRQCHIDQAQFVLKKEFIADKRYDEKVTSDGKFIEELYKDYPEKFTKIEKVCCYYNKLR